MGPTGPHATALWFVWHGGCLWLYSIVRSQRWADIVRDPSGAPNDELADVEREFAGKYFAGAAELCHDGRHGWLRLRPAKVASWDFRKLQAGTWPGRSRT